MISIKQPNGKMAIKHLLAKCDQCCQRSCADISGSVCACVCMVECTCSLWACADQVGATFFFYFLFFYASIKDAVPSLQQTSYTPSLRHWHLIAYSQRSPQCYILIKGFRNNNGDNKDSPPPLSSSFCHQTTLGGM